MSIDYKQINSMITNMNNINVCDAACQKQKKIDRLRTDFNNARNRLQNAPAEIEQTKKAYYIEWKGADYYNNEMESEYKKEATKEVNDWNKTLINPLIDKMNNKVVYYTSQSYYENNVKDLYNYQEDMLRDLKHDYNSGVVNSFNNSMFYIYWTLTTISIFLFLYKKQFNNASYYPFILLILATPFLLHKSYELVFSNLKHAKVNNLFFIYFVLIISLFFIFNFLSKLPFSNNLQPE